MKPIAHGKKSSYKMMQTTGPLFSSVNPFLDLNNFIFSNLFTWFLSLLHTMFYWWRLCFWLVILSVSWVYSWFGCLVSFFSDQRCPLLSLWIIGPSIPRFEPCMTTLCEPSIFFVRLESSRLFHFSFLFWILHRGCFFSLLSNKFVGVICLE